MRGLASEVIITILNKTTTQSGRLRAKALQPQVSAIARSLGLNAPTTHSSTVRCVSDFYNFLTTLVAHSGRAGGFTADFTGFFELSAFVPANSVGE